jgi:hypothetical protein
MNHSTTSPRRAGANLLIALISALVLLAASIAPSLAGHPDGAPGNNGTIKVHDNNPGEPDPEVKNQPHVCQFDLHFFFGDAGQTGDWWIQEWPPTSDAGPTSDPAGAELSGVYEDLEGDREDREPDTVGTYFTLPDGHYKLFWEGAVNPGGQQNIKHKVFWVDCGGQQLSLVKQSDEGGVLSGVSFTLTAQGASTGTTLVTNAQGRLTFDDLDPGTYTLTEVAPTNCVGIGTLTLVIAANGSVTVINRPASVTVSGDTLTIVNDCGAGTVPLLKVDQSGAGRAGAVFTLTGVMGTSFSATSTSTATGSAGFSNLSAGSYTLAETTAPTGCTGLAGTIAISIASNGTVTFGTLPTGVTVVSGTLRVVNTCGGGVFGNLPLLKVDAGGSGRAGAQFTLTGVSGTTFSATVTTIAGGTASFGTLATGSYSLTESRAPAQCTGITTAIAVTVAANGTVSVGTLPTGVTFTNGTLRVVNNCEQGGNLPSGGGPVTTPTRSGTLSGGGGPGAGALPNTAMPAPAPMGTVAGALALVLLGGLAVTAGATLMEVRRRR